MAVGCHLLSFPIQDMSSHIVSLGLCTGQQALPRRVFAPMPFSGLSVCDYMFPDESTADVADRLKEMLDWETPEEDIDISMESNQCMFPIFQYETLKKGFSTFNRVQL